MLDDTIIAKAVYLKFNSVMKTHQVHVVSDVSLHLLGEYVTFDKAQRHARVEAEMSRVPLIIDGGSQCLTKKP